jgi:hypothetical protein
MNPRDPSSWRNSPEFRPAPTRSLATSASEGASPLPEEEGDQSFSRPVKWTAREPMRARKRIFCCVVSSFW